MPEEIKLPPLKESEDAENEVEEVTVSFWYVEKGENVEEGDNLLQVRTDKATFDVPAPTSGTLVDVLVQEEQKAPAGAVLGRIEPQGLMSMASLSKGVFIVFDGPDGCGKSTQLRLLAEHLEGVGRTVVTTREPGGTALGEKIRDILLSPDTGDLSAETEMMLFMASRAALVKQVIRPALDRGAVVLCDRFLSSTVVYQGYVGGMPIEEIERMGELATGGCLPDRTLVLDVDARVGLDRKGDERTRFEEKGLEYHERVRAAFLAYAVERADCVAVVDASGDLVSVRVQVQEAVFCVL